MSFKKAIAAVCSVMLSISFVLPIAGQAQSELERVQHQIEKLEREKQQQESRKKEIENQLEDIESDKKSIEQDIMQLDLRIEETQARIDELNSQIEVTSQKAEEAAIKLEAAQERVEERDKLLKKRVRLMYKTGDVSYLEVLLGSNSFGDFVQRLKALKLIVDSDVTILEKQKEDRDLVAAQKKKINEHLTELEGLFAEADALKTKLKDQRKEKTVVIASLEEKEGELQEIKEKYEQQLLEKARKLKQQYNLRDKLYYQGQAFHWPVPGHYRLSSPFGVRNDPFTGKLTGHKGMDIPAPAGTDIVAAEAGVVILTQYVQGYGYTVMIDHGGGMQTLYAHGLGSGFKVQPGQEVRRGQPIHEVGSTGRSTGNHLHFGVYKNDVPVNPQQYFNE